MLSRCKVASINTDDHGSSLVINLFASRDHDGTVGITREMIGYLRTCWLRYARVDPMALDTTRLKRVSIVSKLLLSKIPSKSIRQARKGGKVSMIDGEPELK